MEQGIAYLILFALIILVSNLFEKTTLPNSLMLVICGMLLGLVPQFPKLTLNPSLVLNVFLPLLIYGISSFASWREIKKNITAIALLSIGHVIFITFLIAAVIYALIPEMGLPLAFVLGSVISPPDDVAIVAIAEKVRMPEKVVTILEGEAMLNDATALILFRFALTALVANQFSPVHAVGYFIVLLIGEAIYGLFIGYAIGTLRLYITNPTLHILTSLITPFCAYLPAELLGGSGILSTAVAGFVIGHYFSTKFSPEFRLFSRYVWPSLSFTIQSLLFLLVGLNMTAIINNISAIKSSSLFLYAAVVTATLIIGRFIWVYVFLLWIPAFLSKRIRRVEKKMPWQYPFIVSWAGMRGAISLAAAFAVPFLPPLPDGTDPRNLLIFLVVVVIIVTLLFQGLSLPWILKLIGVASYGTKEKRREHVSEIRTRLYIVKATLRWLKDYKAELPDDSEMLQDIKVYTQQYRLLKERLKARLLDHKKPSADHDEKLEHKQESILHVKIIEFEREQLLALWHDEKINLAVRNKLLSRLDHRFRQLAL